MVYTRTMIVLALLASMAFAAGEYVDINGAALRPGMTQAEVESALQKTASSITRTTSGPNGIWLVRSREPGATWDHTLDFREGKLRIVGKTISVMNGAGSGPDAARMVNALFAAMHEIEATGATRVSFSTEELSQDVARSRSVAFFVGQKIYVFHLFEPVGEQSLIKTSVDMEERMEAKPPKQ